MMKKLLLLLLLGLLLNSCQNKKDHFDWLTGNWTRMNEAEGQVTREIWKKISDKEYQGLGFTIQQQDTVFKEEIALLQENENWVFRVTGVQEEPVDFPLSSFNDSEFIAENAQNEFPKKIHYKAENRQLIATISAGDEEGIKFIFKKDGL